MEHINGEYFLNKEETIRFRKIFSSVDSDVMKNREAFFSEIESSISITFDEDGGMTIDCPDVQLDCEDHSGKPYIDIQHPIRTPVVVSHYKSLITRDNTFAWANWAGQTIKAGRCLLCVGT